MDNHHHHHHHGLDFGRKGSDARLIVSIVLNAFITLVEFVGGILSGSLALLSDALHNLTDTTSLGIAYAAQKISDREPNHGKTFGYRRAEIIGAFVNLITLVLVALFLVKEAVERFLSPQPIDGSVMLWVAVFGLIANLVSAAILFRDARHSINIRSAFLHILSDGISSVGVVVGGLLIVAYGAYWVDPLLTLAISVYLLIHSYHMLRQTVDILMESTPSDVDIPELIGDISNIDGVVGMHHVHVWQLNENQRALEAHVAIEKEDLSRMEAIKRTIKSRLVERYEIGHSTLEFECRHCDTPAGEGCYEPAGVSPQAV